MTARRLKPFASHGLALAAILAIVAGCKTEDAIVQGTAPPLATAPSAPTGLMATSGNGWATVSWSASSGATSYAIKRASTSGGSYSQIATAASSSYTDSTVTNGTTYFYVVAAINSVGASPDSTQVSATPQAATTAPMAPTGLAATAGNAQVALTWTASTGASSYLVKRSTTSGTGYAQLGTTASTSYTDTTASNGTTYFYVVDAVNSAGSSSDSAQASATPVATTTKSIVITPTTAVVSYGGVFQFTAAISNSPGSTVVWSVQESSGAGTIASDGRYTAPMAAGTFHVVAKSSTDATLTATATVTVTAPQGTFPTLTPGVWKDITPPAAGLSATYGADYLKVSPVDPNVIYVAIDTLGIWRTTDRGSNWTRLGTQTTYDFGTKTTYIDSPIRVEVDPGDANHLVVTQGVRGQTLGFWVSRDGGQNWVMPQAFHDNIPNATNDVTTMVVDPTNFNHILLGSHSPWGSNQRTAGIMETKDGGTSWILHEAPQGWPSGSLALGFLYDPATGQGNSDTWIVGTDGGGFWRTTNAGASWTKVSSFAVVHHGGMFTYAKDGTLYSGGQPYPVRSHDNGVTWEQVSNGLLSSTYYTVVGDGTTLYTQIANTGGNGGSPQPYMSAPEAGGGPWASYQGGAQTFTDGPFTMGYDAANGIMYSANWKAGIWALKVIKP